MYMQPIDEVLIALLKYTFFSFVLAMKRFVKCFLDATDPARTRLHTWQKSDDIHQRC